MNQRQKITNYYKRWNIPLDKDQELEKFKNRVLAAIDRIAGEYILLIPKISRRFTCKVGHRQPVQSVSGIIQQYNKMVKTAGMFGRTLSETGVYKGIESAPDEKSLVFAIQCLFWELEAERFARVEPLVAAIRESIEASPLINVRVARRGHRVTFYPGGAKLLDEGVVNDILSWLKNHKAAAKHLETALDICLKKDTTRYRNLLDELRSALEKLLRSILGNRKSLENQEQVLLAWMKQKGCHKQVRNMYRHLLAYFTTYQNDAVKHGDGWAECEVEYMIYLTGTFVRLLLQLNGEADV